MMSNNTDTLLQEFADRWGHLEYAPDADMYEELKTLLDKLMPTEEDANYAYVNHQWGLAATDDYHFGLKDGFEAGVKWFRSRMKEEM